ncbi:MAG: class IV adenylate cyclase [Candidatus Sericytochromatia bacterium]|nr:class IV adenylate cyclase [Candidatus Sericytochromatia bacterium]
MEIEAKFALDPEDVTRLKAELGPAQHRGLQRDCYLKTGDLPVALRIRQEGNRAWVTLKTGFEKVDGIRVRQEWEPAVQADDTPAWETIFEHLGFPTGEIVEKERETWALNSSVHVVIDEIAGLGTYLEVEVVSSEKLEALARLEAAITQLGLTDKPRITRSYRDLLAAARSQTS